MMAVQRGFNYCLPSMSHKLEVQDRQHADTVPYSVLAVDTDDTQPQHSAPEGWLEEPQQLKRSYSTLCGYTRDLCAKSLQVLENLHGSQSFVSVIRIATSLRSYSILSCAILLLFSLSPLGGQSSLRLIYEVDSSVITSQTVYYPDLDAFSWLLMSYPVAMANQVSAIVSSNILALDTLRSSPVDVWNHPKVPRVRYLEQMATDNDSHYAWVGTYKCPMSTCT